MVAISVDGDDVDLAAVGVFQFVQVPDGQGKRFIKRQSKAHERDDAVRGQAALGHLAATGAGSRAPAVIGVVAGADDRRISHPSRVLPGPP